jgi:hypothetical protein
MLDEKIARIRAYGNNIRRYQRLLETSLSEVERQFIERRLSEERFALASLTAGAPSAGFAVPCCGNGSACRSDRVGA